MNEMKQEFWSISTEEAFSELASGENGITAEEASIRQKKYESSMIRPKKKIGAARLFVAQFKSPIILILLFAIVLSFLLKDTVDAIIILVIVLVSGTLGFWQEYGANNAVAKLLALVQIKATLIRDGTPVDVNADAVVPGDVVVLEAGDAIPGDCLILESNSLFVDEATLTGETYPVEKLAGQLPEDTELAQRKNALWMGTHIISGSGKALIVSIGKDTQFGEISEKLREETEETEFERGIKKFGFFLMRITLILVVGIFVVNIVLHRPVLDSFLFSLALAVGLTPQLLPAIISINLAHGAKMMAKVKVIVKRLASIENFGSMDVLCSDKTGTLTDGVVKLQNAFDIDGKASDKVLFYAYLNASFESGFINPIDEAIRTFKEFDITGYQKIGEEPYDFIRKRLSILLSEPTGGKQIVVTKGALNNVLSVCSKVEMENGEIIPLAGVREKIQKQFEEYSNRGYRTLGLAYKEDIESLHEGEHEVDLIFLGFITLFDPLKPNIVKTIDELKEMGVELKIITGDNRFIAANVVSQLGIDNPKIMTGPELHQTGADALMKLASDVTIFAEVEPNQKEQIIIALQKSGHVVGYMGDGINDAPALHAADVSLSVDSAADVAKEAADIVLLEKNLEVIINGVKAGRITFANTLKYIFMATSANFGNMFSMAGASLFLTFLPLLPKQILVTNLMTDFPEMTIASDNVDDEMVQLPRRWNLRFIRRFMLTFGLISSIFDYMTFGALILLFHATDIQFRTGWFTESVLSACLVVLVIRTRKSFYRSKPSRYLLIAILSIVVLTLLLPITPLAGVLGFQPLTIGVLLAIFAIVALYILTAEVVKKIFYKRLRAIHQD